MIWISDISGFFFIKKMGLFVCLILNFNFLSPWIFLMGINVHIVHACHVETLGLVIFYVYKVMLGPFQLYILFSECGD